MTAIAPGSRPTLIGAPARRVTVSIGVTVPEPAFATKAVRPSGVTAIACGSFPTLIGLPARRVARPTGVTVPETEFATKAVCCRCRARGRAVPADAGLRPARAGTGPLAAGAPGRRAPGHRPGRGRARVPRGR